MVTGSETARVGARLRAAREAAGLSLQAVAEEIGSSAQRVGGWERGVRGIPVHVLAEVAAVIGVSMPVLLSDASVVACWACGRPLPAGHGSSAPGVAS